MDADVRRILDLEAFVRDFKEAVDSGAIKPVHTGPFAKLCYDACRLVPSTSKAGCDWPDCDRPVLDGSRQGRRCSAHWNLSASPREV